MITSLQFLAKAHMTLQGPLQPQQEDRIVKAYPTMATTRILQGSHCTRAALFTALEMRRQKIARFIATRKAPTMTTRSTGHCQFHTGTFQSTHIHMHLILDLVTCSRVLSRTTIFLMPAPCLPTCSPLYHFMIHGCIQARRQQISVRRQARLRDGLPQPLFHRR